MATFTQLASGNWRVQVRRKTRYVAETFRRRKDGEEWALEMERNIDRKTANSAIAAVDRLKERGANDIRLVCLIGAPEGVEPSRSLSCSSYGKLCAYGLTTVAQLMSPATEVSQRAR